MFRRKVEHRSKSFDVSLLIDCSGSMAHGSGTLTRFQTAMVAAYAMADTLHRIGVNFEILGVHYKISHLEWSESCHREMHKHGVKFGRIDWLYMPIFKSFEAVGPESDGANRCYSRPTTSCEKTLTTSASDCRSKAYSSAVRGGR